MKKHRISRRLAVLVSLLLLLTFTVPTTLGFIVTKTDSLLNTFTPYETTVSDLIIRKTVEHPLGDDYVIPENIAFEFQIDLGTFYANTTIKTSAGDMTADENGMITVSISPGTPVGIEDIDNGTKVTVTEIQKEGDGFTVKDSIATKEATISEAVGTTIDFINVYSPAKVRPVNVNVTGSKILEGRDWKAGDIFSFLLEQDTGNDTWVSLGTKTVTYDAKNSDFNKFDFNDIIQTLEFDKAGTYAFRLTEVAEDSNDIVYDETVNSFCIVVGDADMDGSLEIQNVIASQNATVAKNEDTGEYDVVVTFNNTFINDITIPITVDKTVYNTGTNSIGPENFEFVLENVDTDEKQTLKTNTDGLAVFDLTFTPENIGKTYYYKLTETNDGREGVTYSTAVYNIKISIDLDENNKLAATVTFNDTVTEDYVAGFANIYHSGTTVAPPTGEDSNMDVWYILLIAAISVSMILFAEMKRKQQ